MHIKQVRGPGCHPHIVLQDPVRAGIGGLQAGRFLPNRVTRRRTRKIGAPKMGGDNIRFGGPGVAKI